MDDEAEPFPKFIPSSVDERRFDFSSTARQVQLALDTVASQVSVDYKHQPRASSRSPSKISSKCPSPAQLSPRGNSTNRQPELQQPVSPRSFLSSPLLVCPARHSFADYYQARRAGTSKDKFYSRQMTRKSADAASYLSTETVTPSGLKNVLSRLEQVRPATVVRHHVRTSADASSHPLNFSCVEAAGAAAAYKRSGNLNIRPTAAQAYVPGTLQCSPAACIPGLLAPMSSTRPWSGAESPVCQRPVSPQNMLVLRTLALHTPNNIVPPPTVQEGLDRPGSRPGQLSPCRLCSPQRHQGSSCMGLAGTGALSPSLPGSPLHHLICSGCNQQHTMQEHQSCCHLCRSCCHCKQQEAPAAEHSSASSDACNCPCIKAYKKGHRDAQKAAAAGTLSATKVPVGRTAGKPGDSELAAGFEDAMAAMQLSDEAVASALAQAADNAAAAAAATAAAATGIDDTSAICEEQHAEDEDGLMQMLQQLSAMQDELLSRGPPFDSDQLADLADQLAQCVALSQPQHEELLRQALEQQQQLLAVQQRALLDSVSGAGGQPPQLQLPQLQSQQLQQLQLQQLQQQRQQADYQDWGAVEALDFPDEIDAEADLAARERTSFWITQQQQQQQQLNPAGGPKGQRGSVPAINLSGVRSQFEPGLEQGFDGPLAARLPAGASISSGPVLHACKESNALSAVQRILGNQTAEDDMLAAAAATYEAVPVPKKPPGQHSSTISENFSRRQAGVQTVHLHAQQQLINEAQAGATNSKLPGMDEIESVLAAYSAAGVFEAGKELQHGEQVKPIVHFMMAPQHALAGVDPSASGIWPDGAVLHQGPPQVTAVAQLVQVNSYTGRPSPGAVQSPCPRGNSPAEAVGGTPSSRSVADSAWSVLAAKPHATNHAVVIGNAVSAAGGTAPARQGFEPTGPANLQQQPYQVKAALSGSVAAEPATNKQQTQQTNEPAMTPSTPSNSIVVFSQAVMEKDYLDKQLSRLSNVQQAGSTSAASSCSHSNMAVAPGVSADPSEQQVAYGAVRTRQTKTSSTADVGAKSGLQNPQTASTISNQQCVSSGPVASTMQSPRLSVRFVDEAAHASDGAAITAAVPQPLTGGIVQQPADMPAGGQKGQMSSGQQHRGATFLRAGSFQVPESETSSAAASTRPSLSQLVCLQQQQQLGGKEPARRPSSATAATVNTLANVKRVSGITDMSSASTLEEQQRPDLLQLASPASSARTSTSHVSITTQQKQVAVHKQMQLPQGSGSATAAIQAEGSRASMTSGASRPGSSGAAGSDWKQQRLLMQQQLAAQQQQLRQLQSLSNSVAASPRSSVAPTGRSSAVGRNTVVAAAGAGIAAAGASTSASFNKSAGTLQARSDTVAASADLSRTNKEQDDSQVDMQDAQMVLLTQLSDRFQLHRQRKLLQRALTKWLRYIHAMRMMTQSFDGSMHPSNDGMAVPAGDSETDIAVTGLHDLQQSLKAAVIGASAGSQDMEIVISGNVRLQCSPTRQRQQQQQPPSAVGQPAVALASNGPGQHSRVRWASPDLGAPCTQEALAIAANRSPGKCRGVSKPTADATQQAVAAAELAMQAKPLQDALREVHSMIAEMEVLCQHDGNVNAASISTGRGLTHKIAPSVAAAVLKACRPSPGCKTQQQRPLYGSPVASAGGGVIRLRQKSPDKHKLRGQLHHVQQRLAQLEVKMNQAGAMQDSCFCNSAADSMCRTGSPTKRSSGPYSNVAVQHDRCGEWNELYWPSEDGCKGGCVKRVAVKRQALVGRMQDEVSQLQQELAELRAMMPGAYV